MNHAEPDGRRDQGCFFGAANKVLSNRKNVIETFRYLVYAQQTAIKNSSSKLSPIFAP